MGHRSAGARRGNLRSAGPSGLVLVVVLLALCVLTLSIVPFLGGVAKNPGFVRGDDGAIAQQAEDCWRKAKAFAQKQSRAEERSSKSAESPGYPQFEIGGASFYVSHDVNGACFFRVVTLPGGEAVNDDTRMPPWVHAIAIAPWRGDANKSWVALLARRERRGFVQ